jgi:DHA2 family multidrug resistance protein
VSQTYPDPTRRLLIIIPSMLASTMVAIDITIANVALPHMQSSLSASADQIVWVLTSYLVAGAIATPLSGWLAGRFGRKLVMVVSVAGFTIASALCGAANDLPTMVFARAMQGACGAALVPLSQAVLLDITPPAQIARAMAIFALGSMAGPIIGPTLGGWLTDTLSWRWVFFINVPFGILSFAGMMVYLFETRSENPGRFDMFGFLTVSFALAALQLMLDRGEQLDWFEADEIRIYAVILVMALWLGAVHIATARDTFLRPELFADRNFALGSVLSTTIGVVTFAIVPMTVVMTQSLLGYTAFRTGIIGLPRAFGTLASMLLVTRLVGRFDTRLILISGLLINALSLAMFAKIDLQVDERTLVITSFVQGLSGGFMFVPLSVIVFSTLPQRLRNEGAAMYSLTRNLGNAVGISLLQRELVHTTAQSRSALVEHVRPDNPALGYARPDFDFASGDSVARMTGEIARQASMVGYVQIFWLTCLLSLAVLPIVMMMRKAASAPKHEPIPILE